MQIIKIKDASMNFGKALFAGAFDLMSVPILSSIYQITNSENNNTDEIRKRTRQSPKSENSTIRERVIQIPPYKENICSQAMNFENRSVCPNLNDENNRDENRNDNNVPMSPV